MKTIILTLALFCTFATLNAQLERPVMLGDLQALAGEWEGTMEKSNGEKSQAHLLCEMKNKKIKVTSTHENMEGKEDREVSLIRVSDGIRLEYDGDWLISKSKIGPNGDLLKLVLLRGDKIDGQQAILKRTIEANGSKLYLTDEIQYKTTKSFKLHQKCSYKKV